MWFSYYLQSSVICKILITCNLAKSINDLLSILIDLQNYHQQYLLCQRMGQSQALCTRFTGSRCGQVVARAFRWRCFWADLILITPWFLWLCVPICLHSWAEKCVCFLAMYLEMEWVNFYHRGPASKNLRFHEPYDLCHNCFTLPLQHGSNHRRYVKEFVWLYSNKI